MQCREWLCVSRSIYNFSMNDFWRTQQSSSLAIILWCSESVPHWVSKMSVWVLFVVDAKGKAFACSVYINISHHWHHFFHNWSLLGSIFHFFILRILLLDDFKIGWFISFLGFMDINPLLLNVSIPYWYLEIILFYVFTLPTCHTHVLQFLSDLICIPWSNVHVLIQFQFHWVNNVNLGLGRDYKLFLW